MSDWQLLATRPAGTVAALAAAGPLVFAATAAGVRQSADGGRAWTRLGAGGLAPPVEVVAASPAFARDRTLFAAASAGLHRSTDGGATWQHVLTGARVLAVALSPGYDRDRLLFVGTETDGILRSEDNGRTWTSANPGLLDLTVLALALSPRFEADRTGFAATASGLYRTRNGGKAWREVELPLGEAAVQCLAVSPDFTADRLVLAGAEADGLLRSDDGGATWERVPPFAGRSITAIAFSPRYPATPTIAVATADGVFRSDDHGATWRPFGNGLSAGQEPALSLIFLPVDDDDTLLAGLPRAGVARSKADAWRPANDGLAGSLLVSLAISPDFARDQTLFTAGLEDGIAISTDGGLTWIDRTAGLEDAAIFGLAISPAYAADQSLYAATSGGLYHTRDGGTTWQPAWTEAPASAVATGPTPLDGLAPIAALAGGRILLADDGSTWRPLDDAFDGAEIVSLAFSPDYPRDRTLYVGTAHPAADAYELALWRSADAGQSWQRRLVDRGPRALPLALPPASAGAVSPLAGVGSRLLRPLGRAEEVRGGERRPIWRGPTLPEPTASINAIALSPDYARDSILFVATSSGVCISRDGGATLSDWTDGLDTTPIVAVVVSPDFSRDRLVYALGLGGTIWRRHAPPQP